MKTTLCLLAALLLFSVPALAQDEEAPAEDSAFLKGDKAKCETPPMALKRPSDSWQFVDVDKLKAQNKTRDHRLKFQLWYGAARAGLYVRAWIGPKPKEKAKPAEEQAQRSIDQLKKVVQEAEISKLKPVRVGKRAGVWVEIKGKVPDQRDRTKLKDIIIMQTFCFRPEDNALVVFSLEFGDASRAKGLTKDFKKLLKKAKF